jgi:energy-coupling factor transport system ATP-binding protein
MNFMNNIITIENLIFEYKKDEELEVIIAIDNVSLEIERGSFVAIIGRNGSGKSTLAKNLNALLLPTSGTVTLDGFDTCDEAVLWKIRQTAGMVFQNPDNQLVSSIVEDDVAFGPENLAVDPKEIRERVDEALKAVGMYDERMKAPHLLSGGQKQRVALAGVVAMKPKCIILDEPTAMLDPKGREEVMTIIKKLHDEGITILLITHFMEEAARAERVIIMDNGRIVMDGSPKQVFERAAEIRELSLDVPLPVELAERLRQEGFEVPSEIITAEEMVDFICQYK